MAELTRTSDYDVRGNPGPFVARVINHLDTKYMGGLEVELLKITEAGNIGSEPGQLVNVRYMSPFYGQTTVAHNTKNNNYQGTQKSYGMWAIPPDVGTLVLVIFAEGNISNGYWIGCIPDDFMNFMVPGYASTTFNNEDNTAALPTGEYNKRIESANQRDPTKFVKPVSTIAKGVLDKQGLTADKIRGTTTTSARREVPSMVFGWSTPGPKDKTDGAPKGTYGPQGKTIEVPASRLGGSSFVMDDGDPVFFRKKPASEAPPEYANIDASEKGDVTLPQNELVRLKTRTGHQILLHNTEDLIYIGNARGTTWIELTSNGKIDIFAEDSISIHTHKDLNLRADRDINIESGRNISMKANAQYSGGEIEDSNGYESGRIQIESAFNTNILIGANGRVETRTYFDATSETEIDGSLDVNVKGNTLIAVGTGIEPHNFDLNTTGHNWLTSGATTEVLAGANIIMTAGPDIHFNGPQAATAGVAGVITDLSTFKLTETDGKLVFKDTKYRKPEPLETIMKRVPMHEPWPYHENLDPTKSTADLLDRENPEEVVEPTPVEIEDTFKKRSTQ